MSRIRVRPSCACAAAHSAALSAALSVALSALLAHAPAQAQAAPDAQLPAVLVEDGSVRTASSLAEFTSQPAVRTPLAIDRVDAAEIADRGIESLSALVRGLPSVRDSYNTFGYVESMQVRGFTLDETLNTQRDGMAVSSHVPVALENKERVEVLKGVSGMLAGVSAPGGLVNYVLQEPTHEDFAGADAMLSERGSVRLHADLGGHVGEAQAIGYRINAALEERRPGIDHAWSRRAMASAFLDGRPAAGTLVQAEFETQRVREISVPGYSLVAADGASTGTVVPPPIDPRINLNSQPWSQPFESTATSGSLRLQQSLPGGWELRTRVGLQRSLTNDRIAFPDGCSSQSVYVYNGMCVGNFTDIWQYESDGERRDTLDGDAHLHGRATLLGLAHELTFGLRSVRHVERYPRFQAYNFVDTVSVSRPVTTKVFDATASNPNAPFDLHEGEAYAYDVVQAGAGASAWLGLRAARIAQRSVLTDGSEETHLAQHVLTPWLGAGWEPRTGLFAWVSAGSGVEVASVPNRPADFANAGQALPAQRSRQFEMGLRFSPGAGSRLEATLFRIVKPFADALAQASGPPLQVADARRQRHQGVELEGEWQAASAFELRGGATWLDARTTLAPDRSLVGHRPVNTAALAGFAEALWTPAQDLAPGAAWANRVNFTSPIAALPDAGAFLPASWQWDSFARWTDRQGGWRRTLRLGVDNVTDRRYWREAPLAPWGSIYLFPAAARALRISLEFTR
jgi:iron complex outermembrane receptor protein